MSKTTKTTEGRQAQLINQVPEQVTQSDLKQQLSEITDKFENKIDEKETKTTEILAIFITLFTFISVNTSIFTRVADIQSAIWFIIIITISCMVLLSSLFIIISHKTNWKGIVLLFFSLLILCILLVSTRYFPSWNIKLNNIEKVK